MSQADEGSFHRRSNLFQTRSQRRLINRSSVGLRLFCPSTSLNPYILTSMNTSPSQLPEQPVGAKDRSRPSGQLPARARFADERVRAREPSRHMTSRPFVADRFLYPRAYDFLCSAKRSCAARRSTAPAQDEERIRVRAIATSSTLIIKLPSARARCDAVATRITLRPALLRLQHAQRQRSMASVRRAFIRASPVPPSASSGLDQIFLAEHQTCRSACHRSPS